MKWSQLGTHDDGMLQNPYVVRQLFEQCDCPVWCSLGSIGLTKSDVIKMPEAFAVYRVMPLKMKSLRWAKIRISRVAQ